jgi:hypothetical protein
MICLVGDMPDRVKALMIRKFELVLFRRGDNFSETARSGAIFGAGSNQHNSYKWERR